MVSRALTADKLDPARGASTRFTCRVWHFWITGSLEFEEDFEQAYLILENASSTKYNFHKIEYGLLKGRLGGYRAGYDMITSQFDEIVKSNIPKINVYFSQCSTMINIGAPWLLTLAGDFPGALREFDNRFERLIKNGEIYRAIGIKYYKAWTQFQMLDYEGALITAETNYRASDEYPANPAVEMRARRAHFIVCGLALTDLGRLEEAANHFERARNERVVGNIIFSWFWQIQLGIGLARLLLAKGDLATAEREAALTAEIASDAREPTSRALVYELLARIALAGGHVEKAESFLIQALALVESMELPLAAWRVYDLGCKVASAKDDIETACAYQREALKLQKGLNLAPNGAGIALSTL